ncbi:MAG: DUF4249 domain-containing protein [Prolixibacteraceae bacterium]|nr:DUF4249 domain-containing protein [Prolixibacteraceae bacterium]
MKKILFFTSLCLLMACRKTVVTGFQDRPIVESYLYADESPTVKISKLVPFTSDMDLSDMNVNKLSVDITDVTAGKKYALTVSGDGVYTNKSLTISAGKTYELSFPYNEMAITATTIVPAKPQNMKLSATGMAIPGRGQTGSVPGGDMPDPVILTWTNDDQGFYFVYVKNVESVKIPIDSRSPNGNDFFRNQPTSSNTYEINARSFQYYGMHRVILYKIQPEYVLFFQENSNSSLSISEIKANVANGLGIFTGISSTSAYLYVGKP